MFQSPLIKVCVHRRRAGMVVWRSMEFHGGGACDSLAPLPTQMYGGLTTVCNVGVGIDWTPGLAP